MADNVIGFHPSGEQRFVNLARALNKLLLFCTLEIDSALKLADWTFDESNLTPSVFRKTARIMTARKRGFKRGAPR